MSNVRRREFISNGALALTEPRQLMIGCATAVRHSPREPCPSFARHQFTMAARKTVAAKGGSHGI